MYSVYLIFSILEMKYVQYLIYVLILFVQTLYDLKWKFKVSSGR